MNLAFMIWFTDPASALCKLLLKLSMAFENRKNGPSPTMANIRDQCHGMTRDTWILTCIVIDAFSCFAIHDTKGNIVFTFRRYSVAYNKDRDTSLTTSVIENYLAIVAIGVSDPQVRIRKSCSSSCASIEDGPCTDDFGYFAMHCWLWTVLWLIY